MKISAEDDYWIMLIVACDFAESLVAEQTKLCNRYRNSVNILLLLLILFLSTFIPPSFDTGFTPCGCRKIKIVLHVDLAPPLFYLVVLVPDYQVK